MGEFLTGAPGARALRPGFEEFRLMIDWCKRVAENRSFQLFIIGIIVLNAVLVATETYHPEYEEPFDVVEDVTLLIFVAEIVIRLFAYAPKYARFFTEGW